MRRCDSTTRKMGITLVVVAVGVASCTRADDGEACALRSRPDWLAGSGEELQIRVAGDVVNEEGNGAEGFKLHAQYETFSGRRDLPASIDGSRFELRIPVGRDAWFRVYVNAISASGRDVASQMIPNNEVRRAAIHGLKLRLKPFERSAEVTVVDGGKTVPGAVVAAEFSGGRLTAKTDDAGVAMFPLLNRDRLGYLTAWTDDFRLGGYSFIRKPPRDPFGAEYTVELDPCRSQTIRVIDEKSKSPIADLDFVLTVGAGPPNFQYPGRGPDCELRTNAMGEAVCRWFPDWEQHGSYVTISDPRWVKAAGEEMVDGVLLVRLRQSRFDQRRRVVGRVHSTDGNVTGFCVDISSSQGEEENRSDAFCTFTDEKGEFAADYLPGATYRICINDVRLVSDIIDLIPYDPKTDRTCAPVLAVTEGQPVEVVVTSGPEQAPVAYQSIELRTPYRYSWREEGRTRYGQDSRVWLVTTDEQGRARTFALAGTELEGHLFTPEWRARASTQVVEDGVTRLEFHREVGGKRKLTGRLILPENVSADLAGASIQIGSVDGETSERLAVETDENGAIQFGSAAARIGIYARTKDLKAAAVSIVDRFDRPIEVRLMPTGEFRGRLLGKNDAPLAEHPVWATLTIGGRRDFSKPGPTCFLAGRFESTTDRDGNYTLTGLPCETALDVSAAAIDGSSGSRDLTECYLVPSEHRPREISRLWKPTRRPSLAERYERILRDCRLSGHRAMVILCRPEEGAKKFIDANLLDYETTEEVASFMQLSETLGDEKRDPEVAEFASKKGWPTPAPGTVFVCVIDGAGNELGRIELDSKSPESPQRAATFVRRFAPEQADAKKNWDEAFAEARRTGRKVWVRIGHRYCIRCFQLTRWLDDQKEWLAKDYVMLKIDGSRDLHGEEVAGRLTDGERFGAPFFAIFDAGGERLITSDSPVGNIGFPRSYEDRKHLKMMLEATCSKLTADQIDQLIAGLAD